MDPNTYESITGDSVEDDHGVWDSFYKKRNHAFGKEPVGFLKEHLRTLKKGRAFVPAMGEGRNAIFLARSGFKVDGVDLSSVAVDRAVDEARSQNTSIKGVVADLFQFQYPKETYEKDGNVAKSVADARRALALGEGYLGWIYGMEKVK
jgi:hypothetical protein